MKLIHRLIPAFALAVALSGALRGQFIANADLLSPNVGSLPATAEFSFSGHLAPGSVFGPTGTLGIDVALTHPLTTADSAPAGFSDWGHLGYWMNFDPPAAPQETIYDLELTLLRNGVVVSPTLTWHFQNDNTLDNPYYFDNIGVGGYWQGFANITFDAVHVTIANPDVSRAGGDFQVGATVYDGPHPVPDSGTSGGLVVISALGIAIALRRVRR
jgi:hypothetical protein